MSLPGIWGTSLETIPRPVRLNVPEVVDPEVLRLIHDHENRFKIGIVWSGNPQFVENHKRATNVSRFLQFANIPGVQLYSLQKLPQDNDISNIGADEIIIRLGPYLNDFADTAGILKLLDLVIMTDSAVAHLAGSLNFPVWNLLSFRPFWIYQRGGLESPWYPSMRLFRQPRPSDWDSVFDSVFEALREEVGRERMTLDAMPISTRLRTRGGDQMHDARLNCLRQECDSLAPPNLSGRRPP